MQKYTLEIIVFICGAAIMILELVGSRIMAPYLGTSIVVWTSLIGIILGFLSLGYWYGGKAADQNPSYKMFSFVIFAGAIFVGLIVFIQSMVLNFIQNGINNIYFGAIIATITLFAVPSTLLGMVSPYAVRLKMKDVATSGETVGNLYAISTIGSIVGTFAAGFLLIPFLGSAKIIFFLSIGLILISILAYGKSFLKIKVSFVLFLLLCFFVSSFSNKLNAKQGLIDVDTQYSRVWIYKSINQKTQRPILNLTTDPLGRQSGMFLDTDDDLVFEYTKYYRLAKHFKPDLKYSLMIGGAAYSYPKDYLKKYPDAKIDVVEIDSKLTELAKQYFNLPDDPRLTIYHEDGRTFLNRTKNKYDVIFMDAFTSHLSIPYQLTTKEAVQKMHGILDDSGLVLVNIISAIEGEKGKFLRAEYATYKSIFVQVYLILVRDNIDGLKAQNIMLVALKSNVKPLFVSDDQELNSYLQHLWTKEIEIDAPILTDDYAPVDYYTMKMM
ncbi:fused MFS/spermidine synthase [Candidatus Parcubacteria bacterium]|nr:fused MFS/spermidine synthase [Candidatus Parcubacteria bacterium]